MLPSLHATPSGNAPIVLIRSQVKKVRAAPHLPKVSGWRSRAAVALPDMSSHANLPSPGKQKASQSATAHNFAQVQPTTNYSSHDTHGISTVSTSLSFIEEESEDRSSLIERNAEELADTLDAYDEDELDLFDCKATRKWRAKKEREKEKQRRNVSNSVSTTMMNAVPDAFPSRGKKSIYHRSATFIIQPDPLPGFVGALSRKSRIERRSFSDTTATQTKVIMDHMGAQLAKVDKVMDMLKEEEEKAEGCEIDEPLKKAIPLMSDERKPRQTVIIRKMKKNISEALQHVKDSELPQKKRNVVGGGETLESLVASSLS